MRASFVGLMALFVCLGSLAQLAAPGVAEAQTADDAAAQAHFTVAASYYDQGNYEDALREFQNAYRLSHRPQLFYNFSLCYQQLSDLPHAVEYLERYLGEVTEIPNRATLEVRLENLRGRIASGSTSADTGTGTGTGSDTGTGTGTSGSTGTTGSTAAGTGTTGTTSSTGTTGTAGTDTGATGSSGSTDTTGSGSGSGTTDSGGATPEPSSGGGVNAGAIAGFSVAALGLIGVGIFGGLTIAENSTLSGGCGATNSCTGAQTSTLQTFALVSDISWGVSLAGAALGTVLLIVGGTGGGEERAALEVVPLAGPGTVGVMAGGSF